MTRKELQDLKNKLTKTGIINKDEVDRIFKLINNLIQEHLKLSEEIEKLKNKDLFEVKK